MPHPHSNKNPNKQTNPLLSPTVFLCFAGTVFKTGSYPDITSKYSKEYLLRLYFPAGYKGPVKDNRVQPRCFISRSAAMTKATILPAFPPLRVWAAIRKLDVLAVCSGTYPDAASTPVFEFPSLCRCEDNAECECDLDFREPALVPTPDGCSFKPAVDAFNEHVETSVEYTLSTVVTLVDFLIFWAEMNDTAASTSVSEEEGGATRKCKGFLFHLLKHHPRYLTAVET